MKKLTLFVSIALLAGCGVSQRELKKEAFKSANDLIEQAKKTGCESVKDYLGLIQNALKKGAGKVKK